MRFLPLDYLQWFCFVLFMIWMSVLGFTPRKRFRTPPLPPSWIFRIQHIISRNDGFESCDRCPSHLLPLERYVMNSIRAQSMWEGKYYEHQTRIQPIDGWSRHLTANKTSNVQPIPQGRIRMTYARFEGRREEVINLHISFFGRIYATYRRFTNWFNVRKSVLMRRSQRRSHFEHTMTPLCFHLHIRLNFQASYL